MITSFLVLEITAIVTFLWAKKLRLSKLDWLAVGTVTVMNAIFVYWWMPVPTLSQLVIPVAIETTLISIWSVITGASSVLVERVTNGKRSFSVQGICSYWYISICRRIKGTNCATNVSFCPSRTP